MPYPGTVLAPVSVMQMRYRPKRFDRSPLFKVVYQHFEDFQETYHRTYSEDYGFFRRIITHTIERYLACGDPREGVARYECGKCGQSFQIPFSCKTRLFCPSCHEKKTLLWIESLRTELLLPVPHRFWTFSIPNRYQNIRRYAGFYSPNIQRKVRLARNDGRAVITIMDLKEFIFDKTIILKFFPFVSRAPPKLVLESHRGKELSDHVPDEDGTRYVRNDDSIADVDFNQVRPETDEDFNQELNW